MAHFNEKDIAAVREAYELRLKADKYATVQVIKYQGEHYKVSPGYDCNGEVLIYRLQYVGSFIQEV